MKRLLRFRSGADTGVLKGCPADESKYAGIGASIRLPAVLAGVSGGYALFTVFERVPVAVALGVLWGIIVFNLDRVIASGMRGRTHPAYDFLYALPRLVPASLLGVDTLRPLKLKLLGPEIRSPLARI